MKFVKCVCGGYGHGYEHGSTHQTELSMFDRENGRTLYRVICFNYEDCRSSTPWMTSPTKANKVWADMQRRAKAETSIARKANKKRRPRYRR